MKRLTFILMAAAALFTACNKDETQASGPLKADFKMSANTCQEGEEITFEASAEGGRSPYTFNWEIAAAEGEKITFTGKTKAYKFESCAPYVVKLTVVDKDGKKAEKRKNLVVSPAPIPETGELSLVWAMIIGVFHIRQVDVHQTFQPLQRFYRLIPAAVVHHRYRQFGG